MEAFRPRRRAEVAVKIEAEVAGKTIAVEVVTSGSGTRVRLDGREVDVDLVWLGPRALSVLLDGRSYDVELQPGITGDRDSMIVTVGGQRVSVDLDPGRAVTSERRGDVRRDAVVRAPMPGKVVAVLVEPGERVAAGQGILVVEAMKMENELQSPIAGVVRSIAVRPGQIVEGGVVVAEIEQGEVS